MSSTACSHQQHTEKTVWAATVHVFVLYVCVKEKTTLEETHGKKQFGGYEPSETSLNRDLSSLCVIRQHLLTDAQRPVRVDDHTVSLVTLT